MAQPKKNIIKLTNCKSCSTEFQSLNKQLFCISCRVTSTPYEIQRERNILWIANHPERASQIAKKYLEKLRQNHPEKFEELRLRKLKNVIEWQKNNEERRKLYLRNYYKKKK